MPTMANELDDLRDVPVDEVLAVLDQDVVDYRELYYRWERQQWSAGAIDLAEDREQWQALDAEDRDGLSWALAPFFVGKERLTDALVPFVDAAPTEEQQVFLATQLVDVARHTVLLDRFYEEVVGDDAADIDERLDHQLPKLDTAFAGLLLEMLPAAALEIRSSRGDSQQRAFVEGVTLVHLVLEATLGLTIQRFLLGRLRDQDLLPGFRSGFMAVARDATRHVGFGIRFLRETVADSPDSEAGVRGVLDQALPAARSALGSDELVDAASDSLSRWLRAIGLEAGF